MPAASRHCDSTFSTSPGAPRQPKAGESCTNCGAVVPKIIPTFPKPPFMLREQLTARSAEARHFRRYIRLYNSALVMASIRADSETLNSSPLVTLHGHLYHEIVALISPVDKKPRYAALYIHDTDHTAKRKCFFDEIHTDLLERLAGMLHERNKLLQTFISLRDLMKANQIPEEAQIMIHAHEKTKPGHERKYNVLEASEVAALIVGEQYGALDIVLRSGGSLNDSGFEKMDITRIGSRIFYPLSYPLLFPDSNEGWHSNLTHFDSKRKDTKG